MNKLLSKRLGELFAHIQDLTDTGVQALIKTVEENSHKKNKIIKSFSSFAQAYWQKYNEIKKGNKTD